MAREPFKIANTIIKPGERIDLNLEVSPLFVQTPITIPVHVTHGKERGPVVFITAAVHGDEINGVEIIRRLLNYKRLKHLRGTIIAVPVANIYGFMMLSRYLPDRRDLNRSFPGSKTGSLAARLAYLYMTEIISRSDYGIDLHTGNIHSENLPHLRANTGIPGAMKIAKAFDVPVILDTGKTLDGSIRQSTAELGIPVLVYEGGEALRFNEVAIRIGLRGILNVFDRLGMLPHPQVVKKSSMKPKLSRYSCWIRSPNSGIFHILRPLGCDVEKGEKVGTIFDPLSKRRFEIFSPIAGIIIGKNTLPLVNEGDALLHIARMKGTEEVSYQISKLKNEVSDYMYHYS